MDFDRAQASELLGKLSRLKAGQPAPATAPLASSEWPRARGPGIHTPRPRKAPVSTQRVAYDVDYAPTGTASERALRESCGWELVGTARGLAVYAQGAAPSGSVERQHADFRDVEITIEILQAFGDAGWRLESTAGDLFTFVRSLATV